MDDLLKAYAQKRRDEARAPLEMHPATRRMLHAEAAKLRHKARAQSSSWFHALALLWPRMAFAAAMVCVLGVTAWVLWTPTGGGDGTTRFARQDAPASASQESAGLGESRRETEELKRLPAPAKEEALARLPRANGPQPAIRSEEQAGARAFADTLSLEKVALTNTVIAEPAGSSVAVNPAPKFRFVAPATPPPATLPLAAPAPGTVEAGVPPGFAAAESKDKAATANTDSALSRAGKEVRLADELDLKQNASGAPNVFFRMPAQIAPLQDAALARGRFSQVQPTATSLAANKPATEPSQVLANFTVEQTGERLRVVDSDNSVYEGQLLGVDRTASATVAAVTEAAERREAYRLADAPSAAVARRAEQTRGAVLAQSPTWNFRVSGTNRSLRQPVTLEGVLFEDAETNQVLPAISSQAGAVPLLPARQAPALPLQNGATAYGQQNIGAAALSQQNNAVTANLLNVRRIQGQVRVGATNAAPFDAVRSGH
jgi:hypothetical protein